MSIYCLSRAYMYTYIIYTNISWNICTHFCTSLIYLKFEYLYTMFKHFRRLVPIHSIACNSQYDIWELKRDTFCSKLNIMAVYTNNQT